MATATVTKLTETPQGDARVHLHRAAARNESQPLELVAREIVDHHGPRLVELRRPR